MKNKKIIHIFTEYVKNIYFFQLERRYALFRRVTVSISFGIKAEIEPFVLLVVFTKVILYYSNI